MEIDPKIFEKHLYQLGATGPVLVAVSGGVDSMVLLHLINHLSILARVTTNIDESSIYEALIDGDVIKLDNVINEDFYDSVKVFLNGTMVGIHRKPVYLLKYMKLLKLNIFTIPTSQNIV